jgi:hypothetical protein
VAVSPHHESDDDRARVYGWMLDLAGDRAAAERLTMDALRRHRTEVGPRWLEHHDDDERLRYFTARVVLEHRGVLLRVR